MKPWVACITSYLRRPEFPKTAFRKVARGKSGVNSDLKYKTHKKL